MNLHLMYENKAALSHVYDLPLLTVASVSSRMTRGERRPAFTSENGSRCRD